MRREKKEEEKFYSDDGKVSGISVMKLIVTVIKCYYCNENKKKYEANV